MFNTSAPESPCCYRVNSCKFSGCIHHTKQEKSVKMSSQVIIKERVLTSEEWLNKIQAKEIEKEEKEKVKQNQKNKWGQKRNEAVSKKKKSVDNNQPSASFEDYPVRENVETNE